MTAKKKQSSRKKEGRLGSNPLFRMWTIIRVVRLFSVDSKPLTTLDFQSASQGNQCLEGWKLGYHHILSCWFQWKIIFAASTLQRATPVFQTNIFFSREKLYSAFCIEVNIAKTINLSKHGKNILSRAHKWFRFEGAFCVGGIFSRRLFRDMRKMGFVLLCHSKQKA